MSMPLLKLASPPKSRRVLVHCMGGVSRAPSVVMAYLLHSGRAATVAEALLLVRKVRPGAKPSSAFLPTLESLAQSHVDCKIGATLGVSDSGCGTLRST